MTPGVNVLRNAGIQHKIHEYMHDPMNDSYGMEASEKLGVDPDRIFKTLVVTLDGKALAVGVIPVPSMLSMKLFAKSLQAKKASMATKQEVERSTGYVLGGVSPLGQKKQLKTLVDISAGHFSSIYVSAGRRGLEIELNPDDLLDLVNGEFADICQ